VYLKFQWAPFSVIGFPVFLLCLISFFWFYDICLESSAGEHRFITQDNMKLGILLFIFREVLFFFGFFWAFFDYSLNPSIELGRGWPPLGCESFNPFRIPILNTLILLRRGVTVTYSHHRALNNRESAPSLGVTILLGVYFSSLQLFEYQTAKFTICDRAFGSVFFVMTGFHGLHVMIGTLALIFRLTRVLSKRVSVTNLLGIEMTIWY
jgi:cytochrome c oxidase subunit 3